MELSELNPDKGYEDEVSYYHGFNAYEIEGMLDRGAQISKNRRESTDYKLATAYLHEDIIRLAGSEITELSLNDAESVGSYVEDNREVLAKEGSSYTQWLIEDSDTIIREGLHFIDNLVWVSRDRNEARNYSSQREIAGCDKRSGGYLRLSLPQDSVLELGMNGGVPGEIPLEFADTLYLENMDRAEREELWLEFIGTEYDIDIRKAEPKLQKTY